MDDHSFSLVGFGEDVKKEGYLENEETPYRVVVRNLSPDARESDIKKFFSRCGFVTLCKILEPGKGVVHFRDWDSPYEAVKEFDDFEGKWRVELDIIKQGPGQISKAVSSLPPEQMFELMKQMKLCIQNNPAQAKTMLDQNPQLAYALLQAQVIMRIVDLDGVLDLLSRGWADCKKREVFQCSPPASEPVTVSCQQEPLVRDPRRDPRNVYRDPRTRESRDPRSMPLAAINTAHLSSTDPGKAALVMQVLQLTEEQISMLPADQRISIMELKKQINPNGY